MVADAFEELADQREDRQSMFSGELTQTTLDETDVVLLKPQTFMNRSGQSVAPAMGHYQLDVEDLIVIHDELDLPLGTVRVKVGGGSGGHRGLESCFIELGARDFTRIRCGIGRPEEGADATSYVLNEFNEEERRFLDDFVRLAAEATRETVRVGAVAAMNRFNRRTTGDGGEP
jgi:peptidyl-tRNA hydrolase, PTH1 family